MDKFSKRMLGLLVMQLLLLMLFLPSSMAMSEPGCFDCDAGPEFSPLTALLAASGIALIAFLVRRRMFNVHD